MKAIVKWLMVIAIIMVALVLAAQIETCVTRAGQGDPPRGVEGGAAAAGARADRAGPLKQ